MLNIIDIYVDERGEIKKDVTILAMENENDSKTLSIHIPNLISNKWVYLDFKKPDNTKIETERLTVLKNDNGYYVEYTIKNPLTNQAGDLIMEVVAKDENNLVWKSYATTFMIKTAINATENIESEKQDVLSDLQKQIDDISGTDLTNYYNKPETDNLLGQKQDTLIAGDNITITNNIISSKGGGSTITTIIEVTAPNVTLQSNNHTVITNVGNSLNISLAEMETIELKNYSFEFTTIDRIPIVTFTNAIAPYNFEYEKYRGYVGEIINNKVCYKTVYNAYPYQFIYGAYFSDDWLSSYTFEEDFSVKYSSGDTNKVGTYEITFTNDIYSILINYNDGTDEFIIMTDKNTFTINGVVYTKT